MKFMKFEDLIPGDKICIDEGFLCDHYNHLCRKIKNKGVYILRIKRSIYYSEPAFYIDFSEQIQYEYSGDIMVFESEIDGDYPIKIIELGKDE